MKGKCSYYRISKPVFMNLLTKKNSKNKAFGSSPSPQHLCVGPRCSGRFVPWPAEQRGTEAGWSPSPGLRWTGCTSPAPRADSAHGPAPPEPPRGPRSPESLSGGRHASLPASLDATWYRTLRDAVQFKQRLQCVRDFDQWCSRTDTHDEKIWSNNNKTT